MPWLIVLRQLAPKLLSYWYLIAIAGLGVWAVLEREGRLNCRMEQAKGRADRAEQVIELGKKAEALQTDLLVAQAASMATTKEIEVRYVDKIRLVPDTGCARKPAYIDGSLGVRELIPGAATAPAGPDAALPRPGTDRRP